MVSFAYDRGIRVIPETDVPGHSASWVNSKFGICCFLLNLFFKRELGTALRLRLVLRIYLTILMMFR